MHPTLFDFGLFEIRTYGFTLAISFLAGIYLATWRARRYGRNPQQVLDLSVYLILAAVIGARLLYVVFHTSEYNSFLEVFEIWRGGATFYGGAILCVIVAYGYSHRKGLPFLQVADIMAPSLALGIGVTRIGCLMSGCCYGKPTLVPWAVSFPPTSQAGFSAAAAARALGLDHIGLHPTQLYSSAYGFLIFALLLLLERRLLKRGATFGALIVLYGVARFTVDFFRYYEDNARVLMGLSFNQVISVGLVILGVYFLVRKTSDRNRIGEAKA